MNQRTQIIRDVLRGAGRLLLRLLTRTTVTGREYLDTPGPVIYAGNHTSTFDAVLLLILMPRDTLLVGPGDFRLLWPGEFVVRHAGLVRMNRGAVDRAGLKLLTAHRKDGGRLGMFPDGGTWEKPIDDVKSGVAYLSHATGAQIVPMGYGGMYQVWRRILTLRFPRLTVTIGPPLPPVEVSPDRKRRQDDLQAVSVDLMRRIYDLLPPDTQAHYDRQARLRFSGQLVYAPNTLPPPEVSFDALAELILKPNLFSPLVHNARLPVRPLYHYGRLVAPEQMRITAAALLDAFAGDFAGFLEYRLGDTKAAAIRESLTAIRDAMDTAAAHHLRVMFVPQVKDTGRA
ncbi:MAG: 1-acyl-sn-glycerol-3-phosphate acyltransferase [Anaerolineae bacterium]|nr:1-acyl-sn-glycerol-3-phosphate acyltransferase [Anaerolineae bacterium]